MNDIKYDFDDIIISPSEMTSINSRYNDITLPEKLPLFTAPMDTVVNLDNYSVFLNSGINVVLPRTINFYDFLYKIPVKYYENVFISMGFYEIDKFLYDVKNNLMIISLLDFYKNKQSLPKINICIDVANGHMSKVIEYAKKIKEYNSDIIIMAGNIANPETYKVYADSGVIDYVRLGIGNGNACTTTKNGSIGYPMASLIEETRKVKDDWESEHKGMKSTKIIADGGMKDYSNVIKSLALGADGVMIGSMFNKSFESCADNYLYGIKLNKKTARYFFDHGFPVKKYFRGMSTKDAQKAMGKNKLKTSEGVVRFRKIEYHLSGWVENFNHYLRSAMSYCDSRTLEEFYAKANINKITRKAYDRFDK